jgi:Tfp pilus assembly protein PilN
VTELKTLQQKIHGFRPWFEGAPVTVQMLNGLVAVFPEQGDVWAKSVEVKEDGTVSCTVFAKNQTALAAFRDRLMAQPGVTNVGTDIERGTNPIEFTINFRYNPQP